MKLTMSPSSADRWLTCLGSVRLIARNQHRIVETTSKFAEDGITAHDYAGKLAEGQLIEIPAHHSFMLPAIEDYLAFLESVKQPGDVHFVEQKFPLWYQPTRNGYIDSILVGDRLRVTDFKFGEGKAVYAYQNRQCAIYGRTALAYLESLGLWDFPNDMPVTIDIIQPRCSRGTPHSQWDLTVGELRAWGAEIVEPSVFRILNEEDLPFSPSEEACQWCDAAGFCESRAAWLLGDEAVDILGAVICDGEVHLPDPQTLSPEVLSRIASKEKLITGYFSKLFAYGEAQIQAGKPQNFPGWKLVQGNAGDRTWSDPRAAETLLANHLPKAERTTPAIVISPAQAEKKLKAHKIKPSAQFKAVWEKLIYRPPGGLKLVPESDARPDDRQLAQSEFANLDDEEISQDDLNLL